MQSLIVTLITYIVFYFAYRHTSRRKMKKLFIFYSLFLAILGFLFKPNVAYDLYMHYGYLNNARTYGLSYLQTVGKTVGLPTYQYLFWIFSRLPVDNFLGMFTAFVIYFCPLMTIYHCANDHELSKKETMAVATLFLCSQNYIAMVSNVRTPITYAIFVYVLYYDIKYKKFRVPAMVIYIILVFLHPSVLLPIGLRYIFIIPRRRIQRLLLVILLCWFVFMPYVIAFTNGRGGLLGYIGVMLYEYVYDMEQNAHNINANLTYTLRMIEDGGIIAFVLYYRYIKTKKRSDNYEYIFSGIAAVMFGSVASSYHFFLRFGSILIMMLVFPMCIILNKQTILAPSEKTPISTSRITNKRFIQYTYLLSGLSLITNFVLQYKMAEFAFQLFK